MKTRIATIMYNHIPYDQFLNTDTDSITFEDAEGNLVLTCDGGNNCFDKDNKLLGKTDWLETLLQFSIFSPLTQKVETISMPRSGPEYNLVFEIKIFRFLKVMEII